MFRVLRFILSFFVMRVDKEETEEKKVVYVVPSASKEPSPKPLGYWAEYAEKVKRQKQLEEEAREIENFWHRHQRKSRKEQFAEWQENNRQTDEIRRRIIYKDKL